jgi:malate dehydrogenase (oxaloacetate-decarboxylating)(NADP+)
MEGKAVLFKKFAGIDVFDIEVDQNDVGKLVDVVCSLEPTFGGINLEDIKAPECFEVEEQCRARMNIPVFHDDQHGTAIIVAAAVLNALELAGKQLSDVRIVTSGAGAAALACLNLLVSLGARVDNITVTDIKGVVYKGRTELMDRWKDVYAQETEARTLAEVIPGADVFIGLSAGGVLKPEYLEKMADKPLIMALANPYPEIMPDLAQEKRPDAMICTGRSDFPNQVNNVLCFPYIFRGALDVGATSINGDRGFGPREPLRRGRPRLWRRGPTLRPAFADPEPVRSAPDPAHRPRRGAGRDGFGRRRPAAGERPGLCRGPRPLRPSLRLHHEADLLQGEGEPQARPLCGG